MSDLPWLSATELAAAYGRGTVLPSEVMAALLRRIDQIDPAIHAFLHLDRDGAMAAARAADADLRAGRPRGPLHGIPVGFKDNIDVAGMPTTCQSKLLLGNVAAEDAALVGRLRQAGAIILGKMTTFEFAVAGPSDVPFPAARNPWNLAHQSGGSSSGPAVGIAAGLLPLGTGTDTGGSIRNPAGCCGIVGLKPSFGLVPCRGVFPFSYSLDHAGPMARTVGDVALMLNAMAGPDPKHGDVAPQIWRFDAALNDGLRGMRIGFVRHFHEVDAPAHPEMAAALEEAAWVLQAEGASVRPVNLPSLQEFSARQVISSSEGFAVHAPWLRERPGDYGDMVRRHLLTGAFFSAADYIQAQRRRSELCARVAAVMRDVDVLLLANVPEPAPPMDRPAGWAPGAELQYRGPFNATGQPALAMMCGLSSLGLPLSLQFATAIGAEATLLRVAAAYERETGWHRQRPRGIPH